MLEVRLIGPDDWSEWRAVRRAALAQDPAAFGATLAQWSGDGDTEQRWRDRLGLAGAQHALAFVDGEPAGQAGLLAWDDGVLELTAMWVAPAARRLGAGRALIEVLADAAFHAGAGALRLAVFAGNEAAERVYRSAGFEPSGLPGETLQDGRRTIILRRPLP
jgi:ribosomal protein S18 acetylase RimI-like enzyme